MVFVQGRSYTREFIRDHLGGDPYSFLPESGGRIVCGCFSDEKNPEAPDEILVGGSGENGNLRKARTLSRQDGPIPVFLKQDVKKWRYSGIYRARGLIEDRAYIERKQRMAGRSDVVLALQLEPVEIAYGTYLLTWNPHSWPWTNLEEMVELTAHGRQAEDQWSCGNTKRVRAGDRLFLMRQGEEPRGILAAGWATSGVFKGPHWDEAREQQGDEALYVKLRFDQIFNPEIDEILALDRLQNGLTSHFTQIPDGGQEYDFTAYSTITYVVITPHVMFVTEPLLSRMSLPGLRSYSGFEEFRKWLANAEGDH
jgi:hypothetical protein